MSAASNFSVTVSFSSSESSSLRFCSAVSHGDLRDSKSTRRIGRVQFLSIWLHAMIELQCLEILRAESFERRLIDSREVESERVQRVQEDGGEQRLDPVE